jgi:hypothetical protein
MVVDCGGGTVDITVHEMDPSTGRLKELYKATGGPYGSTGEQKFVCSELIQRNNLLAAFENITVNFEAAGRCM